MLMFELSSAEIRNMVLSQSPNPTMDELGAPNDDWTVASVSRQAACRPEVEGLLSSCRSDVWGRELRQMAELSVIRGSPTSPHLTKL